MVSTYGYTTEAALEKHASRDYSASDATLLDSAHIDDKISDAEVFINGYCGHIWTGTIPPDIVLITKQIAKIYLDNFMIERTIGNIGEVNGGVIVDVLERYDIITILEKYKDQYGDEQGIYISKRVNAPRRAIFRRNPLGWS